MLRVTKSNGMYLTEQGSNILTYSQMGNYIREGSKLKVRDTDEIDYTKETLLRIAFDGVFPVKTFPLYSSVLEEYVSEAQLYLIIENGGYDAYKARYLRNAVNNGEYYFEQLEELVEEYLAKGGNADDIRNYFYNTLKEYV